MTRTLKIRTHLAIAYTAPWLLLAAFEPVSAGETTLHLFLAGSDGAFPESGLIGDDQGNLYGTTSSGGNGCNSGCGVVFKLAPDRSETILHEFDGTDGSGPLGPLLADGKGNLYGTTYGIEGASVLYKLAPGGTYTVVYHFCSQSGCSDGQAAAGGLITDSSGNFYGTTAFGGAYGDGTVFRITRKGTETVLHSFAGSPDGETPYAGLVADGSGNLYGTTIYGGTNGWGTVFKVAADGSETVLHSFCYAESCSDGGLPKGGLLIDSTGNLYGTTLFGGGSYPGCGIVYKIAPDGTETIVRAFLGGADACEPVGLIFDTQGSILGVSGSGGNGPKCQTFGPTGCGTVFKITPDGMESVLYAFPTVHRGYQPEASPFEDRHGNLYGTTNVGGDFHACGRFGCGVVFKVTQ